jgi:hypothetical protein
VNIVTSQDPTGYAPKEESWVAYDSDRYDGVPDGCCTCGIGPTAEAAIADLLDQLADETLADPQEREEYERRMAARWATETEP